MRLEQSSTSRTQQPVSTCAELPLGATSDLRTPLLVSVQCSGQAAQVVGRRGAVIWLNGPFGVGKTSIARLVRSTVAGSVIVDPEWIGYVLRRTFWRGRDYQTVTLWRRLTVWWIATASWRRTVIVPMTIVDPAVFADIAGRATVFALTASEATLVERITGSREAQAWRLANVARGVAAFHDDALGQRIPTDGLAPADVATEVMRRSGLATTG